MRYEHNDELKRQIKEKEEKERIKRRQVLEEGREIKQKLDNYKATMERIKREKIEEMHKLNIDPKYRVDLEKYKIK